MGVAEAIPKWYATQQKYLAGELLFSPWKIVLLWWYSQHRAAREGDSIMESLAGIHLAQMTIYARARKFCVAVADQ